MPDLPADPVAAYLAEVRRRRALTKPSAHGYTPRGEQLPGGPADDWLIANLEAAGDVPRLLAAVEKVLELTDPAEASTGTYSDPGGPVTPVVRCDMIREAIRSALLGEGE